MEVVLFLYFMHTLLVNWDKGRREIKKTKEDLQVEQYIEKMNSYFNNQGVKS